MTHPRLVLVFSATAPLLVGCGAPMISGSISARAVPVPVMVGQEPSGAGQRSFSASGELNGVVQASSAHSDYNSTNTRNSTLTERRSSLVFSWILLRGRLEGAPALSPDEAIWLPNVAFTRLDTESESHSFGESQKRKTSSLTVVVSPTAGQVGDAVSSGASPRPAVAPPTEGAPR